MVLTGCDGGTGGSGGPSFGRRAGMLTGPLAGASTKVFGKVAPKTWWMVLKSTSPAT